MQSFRYGHNFLRIHHIGHAKWGGVIEASTQIWGQKNVDKCNSLQEGKDSKHLQHIQDKDTPCIRIYSHKQRYTIQK